jgi:hypothetical protein
VSTTFQQLTDEVLMNLNGYTFEQDRTTHLTEAVTTLTSPSSSPTILKLGSTESLGKGILEIGEELMFIDSFDRVSNTATVAPYGRGYLGTTPSTASVDAKVTISPSFPRYVVKKAINDTIRAMGSSIHSVKQTSFPYNAAVTTYEFDNLNIKNILTMNWQEVGPSREWIKVRRWEFDSFADVTAWGTGSQTVTIGDYITPGRTVKVVYLTDPSVMVNNSDVFSTVTGLPDSSKDVVVFGASYRLLTYLDPARASQVSPQADEIDSRRPYGASQAAARQLFALYTQRLAEEVQHQQESYPARVHYSR